MMNSLEKQNVLPYSDIYDVCNGISDFDTRLFIIEEMEINLTDMEAPVIYTLAIHAALPI